MGLKSSVQTKVMTRSKIVPFKSDLKTSSYGFQHTTHGKLFVMIILEMKKQTLFVGKSMVNLLLRGVIN